MLWKIILPSQTSFTLNPPPKTYSELLGVVQEKVNSEKLADYCVKYIDSDYEFINLTSSDDFETAVASSKEEDLKCLQIFVLPNSKTSVLELPANTCSTKDSEPSSLNDVSTPLKRRPRHGATIISNSVIRPPSSHRYHRYFTFPLTKFEQIARKARNLHGMFGNKVKRPASCPCFPEPADCELINQILVKGSVIAEPVKPDLSETKPVPSVNVYDEDGKLKWPLREVQSAKENVPVKKAVHQRKKSATILGSPRLRCKQCHSLAKDIRDICLDCFNRRGLVKTGNKEDKEDKENLISEDLTKACGKQLAKALKTEKIRRNFRFSTAYSFGHKKSLKESQTKNYKVHVIKTDMDETEEIKPGQYYRAEFCIKNNGDEKWPENVKLICVNGFHKGNEKKIPALEPGQDTTVTLSLRASEEEGKYLSQWRVSYGKGSEQKSFGECMFNEILVKENAKKVDFDEKNEEHNAVRSHGEDYELENSLFRKDPHFKSNSVSHKVNLSDGENMVPRTISCKKDKMKCAKYLNEIFPGDLEEKEEFIKQCPIQTTIYDVVGLYLNYLGRNKLNHNV